MRKLLCLMLLASVTSFSYAKDTVSAEKDKFSYAVGAQLGESMKARGVDINLEKFSQGLSEAFNGQKLQMSQQEIRETIIKFQSQMMAKLEQAKVADTAKNLKQENEFLTQNKAKDGVFTTPSGLQYKIITQGKGVKPTAEDTVVVNYLGTTVDGKEFDNSYKRGQPLTIPLKGVIPGWTEALKLMSKGSTWMLYVPSNLAYGERGAPPAIGPNQALIFKVELLDVKKNS